MSKPNFLGRQKLLPEPDTIYHDRHKFTLTVSLQLTKQAWGQPNPEKYKAHSPNWYHFQARVSDLEDELELYRPSTKWVSAEQMQLLVRFALTQTHGKWTIWSWEAQIQKSHYLDAWSSKWLMIHIFSWEQKLCLLLHFPTLHRMQCSCVFETQIWNTILSRMQCSGPSPRTALLRLQEGDNAVGAPHQTFLTFTLSLIFSHSHFQPRSDF